MVRRLHYIISHMFFKIIKMRTLGYDTHFNDDVSMNLGNIFYDETRYIQQDKHIIWLYRARQLFPI